MSHALIFVLKFNKDLTVVHLNCSCKGSDHGKFCIFEVPVVHRLNSLMMCVLLSTAGWGGNYFMFGGDVKGGIIKGEYPKSFSPTEPTNVGRGRLLPTTSWDALFYGLTQWMGITNQNEIDVSLKFVLNQLNLRSSQRPVFLFPSFSSVRASEFTKLWL